jgi:hypothetical protein
MVTAGHHTNGGLSAWLLANPAHWTLTHLLRKWVGSDVTVFLPDQ